MSKLLVSLIEEANHGILRGENHAGPEIKWSYVYLHKLRISCLRSDSSLV